MECNKITKKKKKKIQTEERSHVELEEIRFKGSGASSGIY